MTTNYTPQQILALPMEENDANASTLGDYLSALAQTCWIEGEGFSGKRPFGNSGWRSDIWKPLIAAEAVTGRLDEDGYVESVDDFGVDQIMHQVFEFLRHADWSTLTLPVEPKDWYLVYLDIGANGGPVLADTYSTGFTKKEAELKVAENNSALGSDRWKAIQLTGNPS